jgi:hypothetical protein
MKTKKIAFGFLVGAGLIVLAAASMPAVDLTGTWLGVWENPHAGTDHITVVFKKSGTNFTGIISDSQGIIEKNTTITNLKIDGSAVSFSFPAMGGEQEFELKLTASGDKMAGRLIFKAKGGGPEIEFVRQK